MLGQEEVPRCPPAQVIARREQPFRMDRPDLVELLIILAALAGFGRFLSSNRFPTGICDELQHRLTVKETANIQRRVVPPLKSSSFSKCSPVLDVRGERPFVG